MAELIKIENLNDDRLDVFTALKEPQLKNINAPDEGFFIAESSKVISRALDAGYEPVSALVEDRLCNEETFSLLSKCPVIYQGSYDVLKQITGFELTGGILCCMQRKPLPDPEKICLGAHRIAVLERIMNPTNIGAIIRSAAAMNIDAVLLTSDCSDPLYRRAARVSMGTVFQIPWTIIPRALDVGSYGFKTVSMALTDKTISISSEEMKSEDKLAIILGSEGDGLLPETIAGSDYVAKIPMRETVDSLNVAAASAVAFWELRDTHQ